MAVSRRIAWMVGGVLGFYTIMPPVSYADKLSNYQSQEKQIQQQQQTTKTRISSLKAQEQSLQAQVQSIEAQLNTIQQQVGTSEAGIARRTAQITQLKTEIAQTQKKINQQYQVLEKRVRVMYESGSTSYFDVLFSATSFSDLLDRLQLLSMIAQQDKKILANIETNKQHLVAANVQLTSQLKAQQAAYQSLVAKKNQQELAQQKEQGLLWQVHSARLSQQAALASEQAAMKNLKSLIAQLIAAEGAYTGPAGGWTWPVPGHTTISSPYGWRTWSDGTREFHDGIDIPAPIGAPIVAATAGKVLYAGPATGFGDWIVIQSANGLLEIYGHMYAYEILVHPGEIVQTGQRIAGVGSNGFSTGPHLHFTVATGFDSSGFPVSVSPTHYVG